MDPEAHAEGGRSGYVEAEVVLEGMAVKARFDSKSGEFSWQPSTAHKGGSGLFSGLEKAGSISFVDELLGFSFGAASVLFRLFSPAKSLSRLCKPGAGSPPRKVHSVLLDFRNHQDHIAFGEALDLWLAGSGRPRRLLVVVNPKAGKGKAREIYLRQVLPLLEAAGIIVTMLETNYHRHAIDISRGLNLNLYDGVACVSGDGIPTEVINGFFKRPDWQRAIQVPIGHIVAGSGNGLAKSALAVGGEEVCNVVNTTFAIIAGKRSPLDVVTVSQGPKLFHSILNLGWGIVSDVDVESEKYRWMGGARLTFQSLVRTFGLRKYHGSMSYLPATDVYLQEQKSHAADPAEAMANAVVGPEGQFLGAPMEAYEREGGWKTIEGEFVLVWGQNVPYAATDMYTAPRAQLADGCFDVLVVQDCTSGQLLSLFMEMSTGKHISSPLVTYLKVRALKLTPGKRTKGKVSGGIVTMDGEIICRGEGVGDREEDPMDYEEPLDFTISQGLLQLFVA